MTLARLTAMLGLACMKASQQVSKSASTQASKQASEKQGKRPSHSLFPPFSTLNSNDAMGSNATTVDDASNVLAYRVRSRQGPVVMVVPASMAMVKSAMLFGFEIFLFLALAFAFLFPPCSSS